MMSLLYIAVLGRAAIQRREGNRGSWEPREFVVRHFPGEDGATVIWHTPNAEPL